jgi:hypothetical protein
MSFYDTGRNAIFAFKLSMQKCKNISFHFILAADASEPSQQHVCLLALHPYFFQQTLEQN